MEHQRLLHQLPLSTAMMEGHSTDACLDRFVGDIITECTSWWPAPGPFLHPWVAYAIALLSCFRSWLSFWPSSFPMVAADFVATLQVACDAKLELLQRFAASSWEPELFIVPDATAGGDHVDDMAIVFAGPLAEALGRHSWDHKPEFLAALRCLRAFGLLSDDFAQVEFVRGMARFAADVANFAGQ